MAARQEESEGEDSGDTATSEIWRGLDPDAERRLMVAILTQAVRDMGNDDEGRSVESVLWWTKTRGFKTTCDYIDLNHTNVRSALEDLAGYDLPVRRQMVTDMMSSVKTLR